MAYDFDPGAEHGRCIRDESRLVVVDETGRVYDRAGVKIQWDSQDDHKTLKVFITPLPKDEDVKAQERHTENLGETLGRIVDSAERLLGGLRRS